MGTFMGCVTATAGPRVTVIVIYHVTRREGASFQIAVVHPGRGRHANDQKIQSPDDADHLDVTVPAVTKLLQSKLRICSKSHADFKK